MLICPKCQYRFPLTIRRYLKAGQGCHVCPDCHAECQIELPGWLKAVELTLLILVVMVWVLVGFQTRFVYGLLLTLVWLAINIPVNIFLDGRYGLLKPVPAKESDELTSPPPPPPAS